MNFSPYEMQILLDVYSGQPIGANKDAPLFWPTLEGLIQREFIKPHEIRAVGYAATEKLNALMRHILSAPDPVCVWEIPCAPKSPRPAQH